MRFLAFMLLFSCQTLKAEPIPPFAAKVMNGGLDEWFDSNEHAGKMILLEFYFNGCPACNENAPKVKQLAKEYRNTPGVVIVEVSDDCDVGEYRKWIQRHNPIVRVLNDCDGEKVGASLGVSRFPTTVLLDGSLQETLRVVGVWNSSVLARIRQGLGQATP